MLTQFHPQESELEDSKHESLEERKKRFTEATSQYFALVSSVDVGIRQQIHALEDAQIISSEGISKDTQVGADASTGANTGTLAGKGVPPTSNRSTSSGGGIGNLDVGWLNSRNDSVGEEMEAELWKKASSFLANLEGKRSAEIGKDTENMMDDDE